MHDGTHMYIPVAAKHNQDIIPVHIRHTSVLEARHDSHKAFRNSFTKIFVWHL